MLPCSRFLLTDSLQLWINPGAAILTVLYHIVFLALAIRQPDLPGMCSAIAISCAFVLCLTWAGAFVVMTLIAERKINLFGLNGDYSVPTTLNKDVQFVLVPLEACLMGDLAIRAAVNRWILLKRMPLEE